MTAPHYLSPAECELLPDIALADLLVSADGARDQVHRMPPVEMAGFSATFANAAVEWSRRHGSPTLGDAVASARAYIIANPHLLAKFDQLRRMAEDL